MCSVVGYVGKELSRSYILEGLSRLEYRGYDSAGFACLSPHDHRLSYLKSEGGIQQLLKKFEKEPIDGFVGIGHTRWSTHGIASDFNAHPHFDCDKTISIVHNGIIENYHDLKTQLERDGHIFSSQTDTETIAHLAESFLARHVSFKAAVLELVNTLHGAYAFICLMQQYPETILVVRKRSPLCIGIGNGEMFIASDLLAFTDRTNKVLFMPDESFAFVSKDAIELYDFKGKLLPLNIQEVQYGWTVSNKQGYEHFMLKEIYEQKKVIHDTVDLFRTIGSSIWDSSGLDHALINNTLRTVHFIGCGTSWHAGRIAQFFIEKIAKIQTRAHLASEFRYMPIFPDQESLYIAVSQSGETADTLEAVRLINNHHMPTLAITNVPSSTMVRESSAFLLTQAKQEIAVASTKSFSAQLALLFLFAHRLAFERKIITEQQLQNAEEELLLVAEVLENSLENYKFAIISSLAPYYAQFKRFIFLGRDISFPFALEAALKLKEIAYIFVECFPGGELKHGPIALIDDQTPIILFSSADPLIYQKILVNAQEVKARSGHLLVFAFEGQDELIKLANHAFILPVVNPLLGPLAMTGLMQFFMYQIAKVLERPIDKPRNLAKSVTVE